MKSIATNDAICPLCEGVGVAYEQYCGISYFMCSVCSGIYMSRACRLDAHAEEKRYLEHNNDVADQRYQDFVSPITNGVTTHFPNSAVGLDFGAGTGPVIAKILRDQGYSLHLYDPFFHNDRNALTIQYDFIACCEVIEHFHNPRDEFALLKKLLLPGGKLFCMTDMFSDDRDFRSWYYKNDPTHVFFYQVKTMAWIKSYFGFSEVMIDKRLILFSN